MEAPSRKDQTRVPLAHTAVSSSAPVPVGNPPAAHLQIQDIEPTLSPPQSPLSGNEMEKSGMILGNVRKNGFERPFGRDQILSWVGHVISAICFYSAAMCLIITEDTLQSHSIRGLTAIALFLHIPSLLLLVMAWISCERIDPAKPIEESLPYGWFGLKLTGPRWAKARYCAVCRKSIPGLDHHCTWLQTCIGQSNYAQFFTIACTGAVQFLSQALYASCCLIWLELPFASTSQMHLAVQILLVTCLLISVPCTIMYFVLLSFHSWLFFLGYGTYEWMLRRRKRQRARDRARAAEKNAPDAATTRVNSSTSVESRHSSSIGSATEFTNEPAPHGELTSL